MSRSRTASHGWRRSADANCNGNVGSDDHPLARGDVHPNVYCDRHVYPVPNPNGGDCTGHDAITHWADSLSRRRAYRRSRHRAHDLPGREWEHTAGSRRIHPHYVTRYVSATRHRGGSGDRPNGSKR